jgi:hypothetical protein
MTKLHPTKDWEFDNDIEDAFVQWFNDFYGEFSLRSEWFYGDCLVGDENTRQDILAKWLHSAYVSGYNAGRFEGLEVGLTHNED